MAGSGATKIERAARTQGRPGGRHCSTAEHAFREVGGDLGDPLGDESVRLAMYPVCALGVGRRNRTP
jgi:hypothetical protein